jgi:hypothetical protein
MKEYYNVLDNGYSVLGFATIGLVMAVIGIVVILFMNKSGAKPSKMLFLYIFTGFAILWTICSFMTTGSEYFECRNVMKNGTYKEVEGKVENFDPMPFSGHKDESFTVNGILFKYSDFGVSAGFNNSKSHGGPIDEGKYVRIRYYNGLILQLWVKE